MKLLKALIVVMICGVVISCNKDESASTSSSSMSASVAGSAVSFSASFTTQNGVTVFQGSSNLYTISIYLQVTGPGLYYIGGSSTYPYATVSNISGTYTTNSTTVGQITLSNGSTAGLYSGTFYFTAYNSGTSTGSITVSNGQFTNM